VRGASALESALDGTRDVRAWIVWEPVLKTDLGPPSAATAALAPKTAQLWDEHRALSGELLRKPWADEDDGVVWDYVAVFPPGARWGDAPTFRGAPVVQVAERLRATLSRP
jgi:hypothetical protein